MNVTEVEWLHDLRMPLQIIQSSAQMVKLSRSDPAVDAGEYVDMLLDSVDRLRRILDGAVARGGREDGPARSGDIAACVREICRRCEPCAKERGASLEWRGNADALSAAFDEEKLARALLNLIFNAIRAAGPGGRVRVTWTALGDTCEIEVADDGPGIPADRLPWIFLRGETDGGHGYGLPIAREAARMMGGELNVRSERGEDHGTAFTLRLPVRATMVS